MNFTELARILKITPQELRDKLPLVGFDIGQKAIKVDKQIANRIISQWPMLFRRLKEIEQKNLEEAKIKNMDSLEKKQIKVPSFITVRDFATISNLPVNKILTELMKNSIFSSLNEKIDFETAAIIGADLGLEVSSDLEQETDDNQKKDELKQIMGQEELENLVSRPPVIVIMGHVDHGKTRLLDAIRETNIIASEAGGITQHIGAYQIIHNNKAITFIDTPGHEAFTAMRNRGAKIADIAILLVAADDGVKPQTIEAYRIIEAAEIPFIVAINKIDKPEANIENTKQELSNQLKIIPEDWGGKTVCIPISAKNNTGIKDLLDMLLLTADLLQDNIKANPQAKATGTIIESHIDKGEGPVATVLVQNGTLKIKDPLCFNNQLYGRVKALKNSLGQNIMTAGPSTPAKIIGLKVAPSVGDILITDENSKQLKIKNIKRTLMEKVVQQNKNKEDQKVKKINLFIKSDVLGSGEAIEGSLAKLDNQKVRINIINKGLGNITEGDINRAETSQAQVVGFNVKLVPKVEELAREKKVEVKIYSIIYELINDFKVKVKELTEPDVQRVDVGRVKVLMIFRTERGSQIIGGKVLDGRAETESLIEVIRNKEIISLGKINKLRIGKQEVKTIEVDQEGGFQYEGQPIIEEGDILQFYKLENIITHV
ncbi:MAG: translation initiation factor IF-2 [Patescibacteria group bacterium]